MLCIMLEYHLKNRLSDQKIPINWHRAVVVLPIWPWNRGERLRVVGEHMSHHIHYGRDVRYVILEDKAGMRLDFLEEHARRHLAIISGS